MTLIEVAKDDFCVPFSYTNESPVTGSRIGGHPPRNAIPGFGGTIHKYFVTVEFDDGFALSIFYSFDIHGHDEARDVILHNNQPLFPSELIHAVVHESGAASEEPGIPAEVSCHRVVFDASRPDVAEGDGKAPFPHSKVGGRPFVDNAPRVGQAFDRLARLGFRQLIQFETPNPRTHGFVKDFPWDPGWLHVLVRGTILKDCDFAFVIQQ